MRPPGLVPPFWDLFFSKRMFSNLCGPKNNVRTSSDFHAPDSIVDNAVIYIPGLSDFFP